MFIEKLILKQARMKNVQFYLYQNPVWSERDEIWKKIVKIL